MRNILIATACLVAGSAGFAAAEPARGVVELFTSQGCSSCPPADQVLSELSKSPDIVTLSFPVDYWDYIGWKDTLASPAYTQRQKGYALSRGDGQVYTPQAVIDGTTPAIGSERAVIEGALGQRKSGAMSVPVNLAISNGKVNIDIGASPGAKKAGVWLVETIPSRTVAIGRGENSGKSITYTNVVKKMTRLGDWTGAPAHYDLMARLGDEGYVVLLQADAGIRPGPILGAARSP
jgi:hypothetical protein